MTSYKIASLGLALFVAMPAAMAQDPEKTETQDQKIDRLIADLGADGEGSYEVRERAQRSLVEVGKAAIPALEKASKSSDLEVASRATEALDAIRKRPRGTPKTRERPRDLPRRGQPTPPDMQEMLKQIEKQLPEGFGKLFKDFFKDGQPGLPNKDGDQAPSSDPFRPRVRTWTWQSGPNGRKLAPGRPGQGSALGMRTGPAPAVLRAQLDIPKLEGRVVNHVTRGGHAERVGIKLYDVIVAIDGRPVRRGQDLFVLEDKACKVELYRKAKLMTLEVPAPKKAAKTEGKPTPKKSGQRKQRSF